MTLSTTATRTRTTSAYGTVRLASASPLTFKHRENAPPGTKPPRSPPVAHLSKCRPPRSKSTANQSPTSISTPRRPAYTRTSGKTIGRGYDRPQTIRIARAIDNAEKRLTHLLFDPSHTLTQRRRPALSGRPILPCIDENEIYPRPLPPTILHPMVRTKAHQPRSRTSHVQDENQPPVSKLSASGKRAPTEAGRPRAVAYSLPRGVFVIRGAVNGRDR
ncbi:hypothetical protein C8T65DRAFT_829408 [Cerioporus squamosus]|nr:hypothetical protein C8T65DRAFT_829408 [Cerioporus squamosus]